MRERERERERVERILYGVLRVIRVTEGKGGSCKDEVWCVGWLEFRKCQTDLIPD